MPQFERDGASIHYEIVGSGSPLLLVAGTASDAASWGPLLPLLKGRQLILIDNRGSGQTMAAGEIEMGDMVEDCVALLDHLSIDAGDVLGHSLGGMIGMRLAGAHPERVRRLVTMTATNLPGAKERVMFRDMARLYPTIAPQDWFRLLFQWLFSTPFFADETNVAAAAISSTAYRFRQSPMDFARQVAALDRMARLDPSAIRCPVLAIAAKFDLLVPPREVRAGHEGIADLRVVTIPGAAHSVHWEQPAAVATAVVGFLG